MNGLLFFYGTLMQGEGRGHVLGDLAAPTGRGAIRGDLHSVHGSFPAFLPGEGTILGEVWRTERLDEVLRITDSIEGCRGNDPYNLYNRVEVPLLRVWGDLRLAPGDTVLTYCWNGKPLNAPIPSGDWRDVRRGAVA